MNDLKISIILVLILTVLFSVYGTPPEMEIRGDGTQERGEDSEIVQGAGDEQLQVNTEKSNDQLVLEVIKGRWDNGAARRVKLTAAGYDYAAVQKLVNERVEKLNRTKKGGAFL